MQKVTTTILAVLLLSGCNSVERLITAYTKPECQQHSDRLQKYLTENPDTSNNIRLAMKEGRILIGMTMEQARVSWGSSDSSTTNIHGVQWQWKYTEPKNQFIQFKFSDSYRVLSTSTSGSPFRSSYWKECKKI